MSLVGKEAGPAPTSENVEALQREIETIREGLDGMVGELDRRRHRLFDVRGQFHRQAGAHGSLLQPGVDLAGNLVQPLAPGGNLQAARRDQLAYPCPG